MPIIVPVPDLARLALAREFGAVFFGSTVRRKLLWGTTLAAGSPPQRVLVGMAQHYFVYFDGNMKRI